jgi:hypothetical protein
MAAGAQPLNLDDANALLVWMTANGVRSARVGNVELELLAQGEAAEEPSIERIRPGPEPKRYDDPLEDPDLYDGETVPGILPVESKSVLVIE